VPWISFSTTHEICLSQQLMRVIWINNSWELFESTTHEICLSQQLMRFIWIINSWELFESTTHVSCLSQQLMRVIWIINSWELLESTTHESSLSQQFMRAVWIINSWESFESTTHESRVNHQLMRVVWVNNSWELFESTTHESRLSQQLMRVIWINNSWESFESTTLVKCPSYAHLSISVEVVCHLRTVIWTYSRELFDFGCCLCVFWFTNWLTRFDMFLIHLAILHWFYPLFLWREHKWTTFLHFMKKCKWCFAHNVTKMSSCSMLLIHLSIFFFSVERI